MHHAKRPGNKTNIHRMRRAYFFAYLVLLRQTAPVGLFSHGLTWVSGRGVPTRDMHILLASLIITGAMCDIVDLEKWESNDAPHDVHQSCRARVDH